MVACRLLGHRPRFWAEGATMHWACQRSCGMGGEKRYTSPGQAARYAAAFDTEDRQARGRRAPLVGLMPLRMARALKRRRG